MTAFNLKASLLMGLWTAASVGILVALGAGERFREPLWAAGTAVALILILMVNLAIYFHIAKDEPWKWFRDPDAARKP